jgi:PucR family transcriptional regulator, purine catabolism regulatory protein
LHQIGAYSRFVEQPALTVRRSLRVPPLAEATVVGGWSGLDERRVRWVAVIEWPVEDFVARDELVLTTGIGCDEERFTQLATEVADAGAAALCMAVGAGAPHPAAPAGARAIADERGMPLIEIPWEVRFADVLRAITDRLLAARYAATMDPGDHLPSGFTDALLHREGMSAIAEALEAMVERPVLVLDAGLAVTAHGPLAEKQLGADALSAQPTRACALETATLETLRAALNGDDVHPAPAMPEAGLPGGLIAPAIAQGATHGYVLVLQDGPAREPLVMERHALGHAAVAVAIETLRRRAAAEAEARVRGDFLWELASGALVSRQEIAAKAVLLGYAIERHYHVLLAEAETDGDALDEAVRELRRHGAVAGLQASRRGDRALAIVPEDAPPAVVPQELARRLAPVLEERVSWGVADGTWALGELADGLRRAERAMRVGRALQGPGTVGDAASLGPFLLLDSLARDDYACRMAAALLEPLERYDRERSRDLTDTLEVFLAENGNTTAAARRLFLNRHSLMYRLRKVEELTGRDLKRHEDRFLLELALRLRRVGGWDLM